MFEAGAVCKVVNRLPSCLFSPEIILRHEVTDPEWQRWQGRLSESINTLKMTMDQMPVACTFP
jgi:hypothetical protein